MPFLPSQKHACTIGNRDLDSNVFIVSERPETIFWSFSRLRNVESTSSMKNIIILISSKLSRRGADNRC